VLSIAALALFGSIMNGLSVAMSEAREREAALITFMVTASGSPCSRSARRSGGLWRGADLADPQPAQGLTTPAGRNTTIREWAATTITT
jgi:hypothetical protein